MAEPPVLLLASRCCGQCLTTKGRIVSGATAAAIVRDCRADRTHFQCHKGSIAGLNVHCRGVHDRFGSLAHDVGVAIGVEIREVDPDDL